MLDIQKCRTALRHINVTGTPRTPERQALVVEAITAIQNNPNAMSKQYYGIKNYAAFGDQRSDCEYGYGPKHGSIVFRIDRKHRDQPLDRDACVYFLLAVLDAGSLVLPTKTGREREGNIGDVIREMDANAAQVRKFESQLANIKPDRIADFVTD